MAIALEQFVQYLTDSGLISADEVSAFQDTLPEVPTDGEMLAKQLVLPPRQSHHSSRPFRLARRPAMNRTCAICLFLAWAMSVPLALAQEDDKPNERAGNELSRNIADLESPQLAVRQRASLALTRAGRRALPTLAKAAVSKKPQTRQGIIDILRSLVQSDDPTTAAETFVVLKRLAGSDDAGVASSAACTDMKGAPKEPSP